MKPTEMIPPDTAPKEVPGGERGDQLRRELGLCIWLMVGLHEGKNSPETYPPARQRERAGEILWELTELIVKEQTS